MSRSHSNNAPSRRDFIGQAAIGAAALGLAWLSSPLPAVAAESAALAGPADEWFKKITGKHRLVVDAPRPHGIFPFAWPKVFLLTNAMTGTPEKDCSVVVVLRHDAIPYALHTDLWSKYKFGEMFKAEDPATHAPSVRNPFWQPGPTISAYPA